MISIVFAIRLDHAQDITCGCYATTTNPPFQKQGASARQAFFQIKSTQEKGPKFRLALIDERPAQPQSQTCKSFGAAAGVSRRCQTTRAVFVSDYDLQQIQLVVKGRDGPEQEYHTRVRVEVVIQRAAESFPRKNNFRIAPVTHLKHDSL